MTKRAFILPLFVALTMAPMSLAAAGVSASFRFPLSNFSGPVLSQWAQLAVDQERDEIYALNKRDNDIRIFDAHGMEIFTFGDGLSTAADIAIGRDGDIFILSTGYQTASVDLLNYRGEHVSEIELQNIPKKFAEFVPDRLVYAHRSLYLVDSDALHVVVADERGFFEEGFDLNTALRPSLRRERANREIENFDWKKKKLEFIELNGFTVDAQKNILFTVPVLFTAFRVSPEGDVEQFGKSGSGPGKFGVTAGIVTDHEGLIYVADRLRSVVLVFDQSLRFQTEFGYRGDRPSNLLVPDELAVDRKGNVYVAQAANRGVSVYRVVRDSINPSQRGEATSTIPEKSDQTVEGGFFDPVKSTSDQDSDNQGRTIEGSEFVY